MHNQQTNTNALNRLFQYFIGITCLLFLSAPACAQVKDSAALVKPDTLLFNGKPGAATGDTVRLLPQKKYHSPKKAALFSAVLPGAGQVYNKKWWKVPIIYAGGAGLAYSFQFNQSKYIKYRTAYKYRIDNDASTVDNYVGVYSDDNLNTLQKYYHRYRDLTVIGFAALYTLNIIDASVDAHLFTFDVSDDLSVNIHPTLINTTAYTNYTTGIGLTIHF
ncbi:MAG: DUF5683 domain-containing protein [Bacteroidia bacterium]